MDAAGRDEYCESEPDARLMRGREGTTLVGYNVQNAVEAETRLIVHHEVTNEQGDTRALWPVAEQAKALFGGGTAGGAGRWRLRQWRASRCLRARGHHGERAAACDPRQPRRALSERATLRTTPSATCTAVRPGQELRRAGVDERRKLHLYRRSGCNQCPLQSRCTPSQDHGWSRGITSKPPTRAPMRGSQADPRLMRRRMSIAERPFAILKQVMAFKRFSCRGLKGAGTEMAIAVLGYNLLQMIQRLGAPRLIALMN